MLSTDLILLNFATVRQHSMAVWTAIPHALQKLRPEGYSLSCIELVRQVLEKEIWQHHILVHKGASSRFQNPLHGNPYSSIEEELLNAQPYREKFLKTIHSFSDADLESVIFEDPDTGKNIHLGSFLLRSAAVESATTGKIQALSDFIHFRQLRA